jgi:hypothetical protein
LLPALIVKLPEALNIKYVYVPSLLVAAALDVYEKGDAGAIDADADDAPLPIPIPEFVVMVKVYEVPLVRPETTIGEDEPVPVNPPGLEVTV